MSKGLREAKSNTLSSSLRNRSSRLAWIPNVLVVVQAGQPGNPWKSLLNPNLQQLGKPFCVEKTLPSAGIVRSISSVSHLHVAQKIRTRRHVPFPGRSDGAVCSYVCPMFEPYDHTEQKEMQLNHRV